MKLDDARERAVTSANSWRSNHTGAGANNQRVDACKDKDLAHNRDEEKEHAAMVLEWIRRKDPRMDKELRDYLFTDEEIAHT